MSYITLKMALLSFALVYYQPGFADIDSMPQTGIQQVQDIQHEWARLYYAEDFTNEQYKQLQALARRANRLSAEQPQSAEALAWDAIVLSTLAEKKGGIGALSLVKEAKTKLEKAENIDPDVLGGSVYASLATLYSKVPGWPIGFGSDKKAESYFAKALAVNPEGLDNNYFYAEFLADNNHPQEALEYVEKAIHAPALNDRPIADQGRRKQAHALRARLLGQ